MSESGITDYRNCRERTVLDPDENVIDGEGLYAIPGLVDILSMVQ